MKNLFNEFMEALQDSGFAELAGTLLGFILLFGVFVGFAKALDFLEKFMS